MNHFIALSFERGHEAGHRARLAALATESLSALHPSPAAVLANSGDLTVVGHRSLTKRRVMPGNGCFMLNLCHSATDTTRRRQLATADLADAWFDGPNTGLEDLAAPFALCGRRRPDLPFTAISDRYGLTHVYGWQGRGVCAVSSSALLIGRVFGLRMDLDAVGRFALLGHYSGASTPVREVRKCVPGRSLEISHGRIASPELITADRTPALSDAVCLDDGVAALREAVHSHVDAYPECDIELSGGIDSRLMLSAIPRHARRRHVAVTLGAPDSADVRIARLIAESNGMRHRVIDTCIPTLLEPDVLLQQLHAASARHDHAVNPVDKVAIESARAALGENPRLSGQNGEIARGFYYPGQPLHGDCTPARIDRLLRWRLLGNDTAREDLFRPDYLSEARRGLAQDVTSLVAHCPDWPRALDQLYLGQRMQRWCGSAVSAACSQRPILLPFFHPGFVDWAMASTARAKRGSRLACQLMSSLAPELSSLPLDGGRTPSALARSGPLHSVGHALALGRKLSHRVHHRLAGTRRHNLGTRSVTEMITSRGLEAVLENSALHATGILEPSVADAILDGQLKPDRATLGFLLALGYTIDFLDPGTSSRRPAANPSAQLSIVDGDRQSPTTERAA